MLLFWFQIVNGYSGSNPVDGVNLFMFNLAYTSLPIIVVGVADQDLKAEVLLKNKSLYNQGRLSQVYTKVDFWISMLEAFLSIPRGFLSCFLGELNDPQSHTVVSDDVFIGLSS